MKLILQRYLLKEFLRIFIPTLAVLEFLLILGMALQSLHEGVNVTALTELAPHIFFYSLPTALPVALLAATVITYGRLSGDNELWAMLTSGVHLWIIVTPVIVLGFIFSLFSLGLNAELLPKSYHMLKILQERAVNEILAKRLGVAQGKMRFPPYYIYIKSVEGGAFKGIIILEANGEEVTNLVLAEEGSLSVDADNNLILFALNKGKFIKPGPYGTASTPTAISFDRILFRVPLGLGEYTAFKKFSSLEELLKLKSKTKREIKAMRGISMEKKLSKSGLRNRFHEVEEAYQNAVRERTAALVQAEKSQEIIAKEKIKLQNIDSEAKVSENYVRIAEDALGDLRLSKELTGPAHPQLDLKDKDIKIKELTQTIEIERSRIEDAGEQKRSIRNTIEIERQNLALFKSKTESLKIKEADAEAEYERWKKIVDLREKIEKNRDLTIAIHRRLSPAFSCLAFVLVGIPIGIMTRRGNILMGFFISFLVVLLIYYPLVTAGKVLASDEKAPIIPTMWGPNLVITAIAVVLLIKVFKK
ncbi:MAG TPA: LptF/LptG family permease [Candidatus Hypogeohydataceae bacterium YC41]